MRSRSESRRRLPAAAIALLLGWPRCAVADELRLPSASTETADVERAREAFRRGVLLAKERRFEEAIEALRESDRLKPHPTTRYNAAVCERELSRHARAYATFASALSLPGEPLEPDFVARVRRSLSQEAASLGRVQLVARGALGRVRVDGMDVFAVSDGEATRFVPGASGAPVTDAPPELELWMDAGDHVLSIGRDGDPPEIVRVRVAPGTTEVIDLRRAQPPAGPLAVTLAPAAGRPAPPAPLKEPGPDRTWSYAALGVGAAALGASGVFAILSLNEKAYLEPRCGADRVCPAEYSDEKERMERFAAYATVGLVAGLVSGAAGAYLWMNPPAAASGEVRAPRSVQLRPYVTGRSIGIDGTF